MPLFAASTLAAQPMPQDAAATPAPAAASGPWRLDKALGTPDWLTLSGHVRARYEYLSEQFRAGLTGPGDLVVLRTSLRADVDIGVPEATLEILDSRAALSIEDSTPIDTSIVNPLEILQAYVGARGNDVFSAGDEGFVLAGRHTMDIGSRRLVARNRFRNTINSFTGINATLDTEDGASFRGFFTLPVTRRLDDASDPNDTTIEIDDETSAVRFWGLYASTKDILPDVAGEVFYYDLDESDEADLPTRNRQLGTTGLRVWREAETEAVDFEVEAAYQFGTSRASASTSDATDLDHSAHFEHAEVGYSFRGSWSPRLVFQFDYASGDRDPNDGENNRFDSLYGARRFDFGPTGIFGPFQRSNLVTPGLRLLLKPSKKVELMLADRFYYLASDTDAWVGPGVRDTSGQSGDYIGNMVELAARWKLVPQNVVLEMGGAHLFQGGFAEDAPNANPEGDSSYAYVEVTLTF